ncbi:MAG: elongation factor P maturation arginine rhamnosyltransferase EarP [Bacteroides sp.]|nr:elongation factor P maturation arginine rhamnosyltransferase EarP [Prevotella sp.]MCM1408695.1 elongation factor P maturation arginine rhamnosyltransferase EarP [Treponema brennaborense]MCM1470556.1 elongation factor P maturation arginine rhamnosyltransferase EarP [Bacteroides sp.]
MKYADITLLCRVIDNFGDIGTAYRLARALSEPNDAQSGTALKPLRLVVDNLSAFAQIAPGIQTDAPVQDFCGWKIYRWDCPAEHDASDGCRSAQTPHKEQTPPPARNCAAEQDFIRRPPQVIIECFACGRPEWLENILFGKNNPRTAHIINLEYLTAEAYAEEFHKLPSLTRAAKVKKVNFMPGFTEKTGGLILDKSFMRCLENADAKTPRAASQRKAEAFPVVIFGYEQDFSPVAAALSRFNTAAAEQNSAAAKSDSASAACGDRSAKYEPCALAAAGKSSLPFLHAWEAAGKPFPVQKLPFMPQQSFDELLCRASFLFIRGEDSLSRACLAGIPFVWHAYPQSDAYQLVKVQALLNRMRQYFSAEDFSVLEAYWLLYNGAEPQTVFAGKNAVPQEQLLFEIFLRCESLKDGFSAFARDLRKNGNLAAHLLTFIAEMI